MSKDFTDKILATLKSSDKDRPILITVYFVLQQKKEDTMKILEVKTLKYKFYLKFHESLSKQCMSLNILLWFRKFLYKLFHVQIIKALFSDWNLERWEKFSLFKYPGLSVSRNNFRAQQNPTLT